MCTNTSDLCADAACSKHPITAGVVNRSNCLSSRNPFALTSALFPETQRTLHRSPRRSVIFRSPSSSFVYQTAIFAPIYPPWDAHQPPVEIPPTFQISTSRFIHHPGRGRNKTTTRPERCSAVSWIKHGAAFNQDAKTEPAVKWQGETHTHTSVHAGVPEWLRLAAALLSCWSVVCSPACILECRRIRCMFG